MTVQEYGLKFNQLSRDAPHMVADSKAQMNNFLYVRLSEDRVQECYVVGRHEHL